jgi:Anti-sigma factor NepR
MTKDAREMADPQPRPAVKLGSDIKTRVGQQLRVAYGEVMGQGVPDRCRELLNRLDALDETASPAEPSPVRR